MRVIAQLGTILLVGGLMTAAYADDDLDSLLGELSYGVSSPAGDVDASTSDALDLLDAAADADSDASTALDNVGGFQMPVSTETDNAVPPLPASDPSDSSLRQWPVRSGPPLATDGLQDRLNDAPTPSSPSHPTSTTSSPSSVDPPQQIDFQALFHSQAAGDPALGHASSCGCRGTGAGQCSCGRSSHGCLAGGQASCDQPYQCRPHRRPTLPPPSTFLQYFHARDAQSDLWAGYAREAQRRDDHYYRHSRNTCDCRDRRGCLDGCLNCSPPLYRAAVEAPCRECDDGSCDHHLRH